MLRESASAIGSEVDLGRLATDGNVGVEADHEIVAFTDALIDRNEDALFHNRRRLADAVSPVSAAKVAAVVGNFQMMNRILDATGVPTPPSVAALAKEIGVPAR